jgi:hypothetical protein
MDKKGNYYSKWKVLMKEGSTKMKQNASKHLAIKKRNGSEIFRLKTLRGHISANNAQITFRVFGIDFWAQFTLKIEIEFF